MCRMHANGGAMNRKRLSVSDGALPQSASAREFKKGPKRRPRHCVKKRNRARLFAPAQAILESRVRQNPSQRASRQRGARFRLSKNLRELERAAALSNFQSCPAACTVGTGRFLRRKISFSREKIVSLQAPRPKNLRFLAETGEGGSGGGACFPVHQLVKTFLTSWSIPARGYSFPQGRVTGSRSGRAARRCRRR